MTVLIAHSPLGMMVSDTRDSIGDLYLPGRKIERAMDGSLFGIAGDPDLGLKMFAWYNWHVGKRKRMSQEPHIDPIEKEADDAGALILAPDRAIYLLNIHCQLYRVHNEYWTLGSGDELALGALDAGASPERAAEIACGRKNNCGLPLQVAYLKGAKP